MPSVSIIGCGYTGLRLAERLSESGCYVRGFATRPDSLRQITDAGIEAHPLDLDAAVGTADFTGHLIYYAVPPARQHGDPRLERFLNSVSGVPMRIVYLSTTGVYGDQGGAVVTEETPPAPRTERAMRRLAAEAAVRSWADSHHVSWCVLRIPGIYGPGRLPLDRLRRREPAIVGHESTPGNRIHVTDLVTACVAAGFKAAAGGRIYNVTDGSDETLTGYLRRVATIAGLPSPPLISRAEAEKTFSASSWSFLAESRRVDNSRMRQELGVELKYLDIDAGIRASLGGPRLEAL